MARIRKIARLGHSGAQVNAMLGNFADNEDEAKQDDAAADENKNDDAAESDNENEKDEVAESDGDDPSEPAPDPASNDDLDEDDDEAKADENQNDNAAESDDEQPPDDDDDALPDSAAPVHIKDEDEGDNDNAQNKEKYSAFFDSDTEQFMALFESIQSSFNVAVTDDDQDSLAFYNYLIRYFGSKARKQDFCLGSDENDAIMKAVKLFEDTKWKMKGAEMENNPGVEFYKHLLTHIVNECEKKLPLAW